MLVLLEDAGLVESGQNGRKALLNQSYLYVSECVRLAERALAHHEACGPSVHSVFARDVPDKHQVFFATGRKSEFPSLVRSGAERYVDGVAWRHGCSWFSSFARRKSRRAGTATAITKNSTRVAKRSASITRAHLSSIQKQHGHSRSVEYISDSNIFFRTNFYVRFLNIDTECLPHLDGARTALPQR